MTTLLLGHLVNKPYTQEIRGSLYTWRDRFIEEGEEEGGCGLPNDGSTMAESQLSELQNMCVLLEEARLLCRNLAYHRRASLEEVLGRADPSGQRLVAPNPSVWTTDCLSACYMFALHFMVDLETLMTPKSRSPPLPGRRFRPRASPPRRRLHPRPG